jgi:hypothetical protein
VNLRARVGRVAARLVPALWLACNGADVDVGDRVPGFTSEGCDGGSFCDAFDTPSPGGRAGDLDEREWSVARLSGLSNPPQGEFEYFEPATSNACGSLREGIVPSDDFFFCSDGAGSSHLVNAYNDGSGYTIHSMRIRRPFDFAGRTGVISFEVDGKSLVDIGHGIWWSFVLSEHPEPAPNLAGGALQILSRQAIGVEFQGGYRCDDYSASLNSISSVFSSREYEVVSEVVPPAECFRTREGVPNRVEIHVSETSLDVRVADAGAPETLRTIVRLDASTTPAMFPLGFSRGYVHLQHLHFNAATTGRIPSSASYHWDDVSFDGPVLATPRAYAVPDSLTAVRTAVNVGYSLDDPPFRHVLSGVDLAGATRALLTLNTTLFAGGDTVGYRWNEGAWHDVPFAFPGDQGGGARPIVWDVALDELVSGDNVLELRGTDPTYAIVVSQIELTIEID